MLIFSKVREVVWGKPAATQAERTLIVKLDFVILSFCCLMYWVNYLDRMNLNNAYVSGMKEDLNFKGKELNVINTSECPAHSHHYARLTMCSFLWWLCSGPDPQQHRSTEVAPSHLLPWLRLCMGSVDSGNGLRPSPVGDYGHPIHPGHF